MMPTQNLQQLYKFQKINVKSKRTVVPSIVQKQSSKDVLGKRCSENMQQIYRRTPTPKWHFNKVAYAALLKSYFGMGVLL